MNKLLRCILVVSMLVAQFPVMSTAQASESESSENTFVSEGTDQSLEETESKSQKELVDASDEDRYTESSESTQDTIVSSEQSSQEDSEEETTMSSDPLIQYEDDLDDHDGTPNREATSIASGTFGTSAWYITEEGVLHIGAGRFGVSAINNGPWWGYRATITKITFDGPVVANANSSYLFQSLSATEIEGLENLDTSSVTNMEGMFLSAKINNLDLSSFNTSRVTNMASMFNSMSELESIDVSGFDTRNVTRMNSMFMSTSLTSLNLSNFDTSKVTRIQQMFDGSRNLAELVGAENWDTSNVVDMGFLFRSTAFTNLDLTDWNVSRVSNMQQMFSGMTRLNSLDISSWNTASLTVFPNIFASTTNLSELKLGENSLFSRNNANTGLPNINRSGFSGRWVGQNMKNVYSNSAQFMSKYDGSFPDTYVWEASAGDVIVRYVDREGNALVSEVTLSGFLGDSYESEPREISGWHIVETPSNASGAYTEEAQEVIYVYDRSDAAPVTVRYVDTEGNQLSEPSILSGKVGLPYESEGKEIPGWYVIETPDNASGTFTEDPQEVVYVYDRSDAAPVTVRYLDTEGNQLSEPSILSGKVGLPYESEAKEIRGWYVIETPDNASGTFTEDLQEVVYVYDRSDAAPVTVRYLDTEGNQLSEPSILSGKVGLPYESEAKEIRGWYVTETPDNASGTFTEEPQEVVYVYDRSNAAPVTVRYVDTEGNQLSEPHILSGKVGLPYESEAKEIPGWYVIETPDNASGTFTEDPQEVVYVYDRSDAAPVTVRYLDTEGNQLSEPSILSGKVGLPYESEAKEIRGWYVIETPDNASGTFTEDLQEVVYVYDRSDAAPVTVRYLDTEGNQLSEPSILSGKVGLPYESEAKEIRGWYVTETPDNASGTFTEEPQEVVYVYDRSNAAPVTVRYVDTEGNQLSEPHILSGKVGLPYESEAKEIPGWYVTETPDNASGTFTEEPQEVVYVYDRSDAAPVTVKYQDSEGNQLSEPSILSGKVGLPYESEAKEIPGWYVIETPDNASGTFTEDPQEVVYVYDRSDAAPVTVRYLDTEGNQLSEPSILSGKVGLPYESEAKEIRGWYVIETPDNASGTFTEDLQEVVYVYDRSNAAPVTVRYVDTEGNQLSEPHILSGKVGLPYESEAKEIPGWYVTETPDNASGTFTEDPQEVVYVYDRSDAAPVTVKYVDTEGDQLSEPSILSGKVGLPYESEAEEISGWYVVETPANASGTFTEDPQEVVYVYDRSDAAPVTVRYVDTEGNQLSEPSILSGKVGLPYESEAKEIRGWHVTAIPDNASGIFTEEPQEVVYIYSINKIDSEHDNSDNNLPTDNNFSDSHKRLPDTGESLIGQLSMILAGLLIVIGIFVFLVRRRKNNKD